MGFIYKILREEEWRAFEKAGVFHGAPIDIKDGYIHFSTQEQLEETKSKHFQGESPLYIVTIDARQFEKELKWEVSRGGALFPHLYASFKKEDVVAVKVDML